MAAETLSKRRSSPSAGGGGGEKRGEACRLADALFLQRQSGLPLFPMQPHMYISGFFCNIIHRHGIGGCSFHCGYHQDRLPEEIRGMDEISDNMTRNGNGHANGHELSNQEVHKIHIQDSEREAGIASPEVIAEAVTYLHRDGIIVLENVVDPSHIDALQAKLGPEAEEIARNPDHHFNWNKGNMDQAPPLIPDFMFGDVWANPIVVSVLSSILGPFPVSHYANGNTALKSTSRQPVHSDIDKPHPLFPFAYAVNIPLCDVSVENGATEIWLGSHRDSNIDQHNQYADGEHDLTIKTELVEERRQHSPPVQPSTKKGSIILRDLRLWHAGMPNKTTTPRIMLAFVIQPKWFQAPSKVLFPVKAKKLVQQWERNGLEYAAKWVDGDVDHKLVSSNEVDFSTGNKRLLELGEMMRPPVH